MKFIKLEKKAEWIEKHKKPELYRRITRSISWHRLPKDTLPVCFSDNPNGKTLLIVAQSQRDSEEIHKALWPWVSWYYVDKSEVLKVCKDWEEEKEDEPRPEE